MENTAVNSSSDCLTSCINILPDHYGCCVIRAVKSLLLFWDFVRGVARLCSCSEGWSCWAVLFFCVQHDRHSQKSDCS